MRKLLALICSLGLLAIAPATAAQKTKAQLGAEIISQLPSSGTGQITAAILRSVLQDMVDSDQQIMLLNQQTGVTYTFLAGDQGKLVTFNNAAPVAVDLPQAIGSFGAGYNILVQNLGAGAVTITPALSTINGAATLVLTQNQIALIVSAGLNVYRAVSYGLVDSVTCGAGLSGGVITTSGTCSITDTISANSSVGSTTLVPIITFNSRGQLTTVTTAQLATIASSGSASDLTSGTVPAARMPGFTGDISSSAGSVTTAISNGAVTFSKLQNVAALSVIGNTGAVSTVPSAVTYSQFADTITNQRGTFLYRGSANWQGLGPCAAGQIPQFGGTGADMSCATVAGTGTVTSIVQGAGLVFSTTPLTAAGTISADLTSNSNIWGATANKVVSSDTLASSVNPVTVSTGATITLDFSTGIDFNVTLSTTPTFANPTNVQSGRTGCVWITQPTTTYYAVPAFGTNWKFASAIAPTLTTTSSAVDVLCYKAKTSTFVWGALSGSNVR